MLLPGNFHLSEENKKPKIEFNKGVKKNYNLISFIRRRRKKTFAFNFEKQKIKCCNNCCVCASPGK